MTTKIWFLCASCYEQIRHNLRLKELPSADANLSKHKCDYCGKMREGSVYRVEDLPKGGKDQ